MAEQYTIFAGIYDLFMENVPYDEWFEKIKNVLRDNDLLSGTLVDLGCGTGEMTERFAKEGYRVIGIDMSDDMLNEAYEKKIESGNDILYLNQDITEFEVGSDIDVFISVCDTLNYITDEDALNGVFARVSEALSKDGLFIFDMNTYHKYEDILANNTFAENAENASFIWENTFDKTTEINEYYVTFYVETEDGLYERYEECHNQRAYTQEKIIEFIENNGMTLVSRELSEDEDRAYYVVKKL